MYKTVPWSELSRQLFDVDSSLKENWHTISEWLIFKMTYVISQFVQVHFNDLLNVNDWTIFSSNIMLKIKLFMLLSRDSTFWNSFTSFLQTNSNKLIYREKIPLFWPRFIHGYYIIKEKKQIQCLLFSDYRERERER